MTSTLSVYPWVRFIRELFEYYENDRKITLVMDNLNTRKPGSLYATFSPQGTKRIRDRFEFVYGPKHGSWLNIAEVELNVLIRQCLNGRMGYLVQGRTAFLPFNLEASKLRSSSLSWLAKDP